MSDIFIALPSLETPEIPLFRGLPPILPKFSVPRLKDEPQNPIITSLPFYEHRRAVAELPRELVALSGDLLAVKNKAELRRTQDDEPDVWEKAACSQRSIAGKMTSWDTLRAGDEGTSNESPFLSDQPLSVFAAARQHAYPRVHEPNHVPVTVYPVLLLHDLRMVMTGCSSTLYTWNTSKQSFALRMHDGYHGKTPVLSVEGMDEVVTSSLMARLLNMGTLVRRLDSFVTELRMHKSGSDSTVHAFAHALTCVLKHLQACVSSRLTPSSLSMQCGLGSVWLSFEETERSVQAVAVLCNLTTPNKEPQLLSDDVSLISRIYDQLQSHIERRSPRHTRAIMAYILTVSCKQYFSAISRTVGFGPEDTLTSTKQHNTRSILFSGILEDESPDTEEAGSEDEAELTSAVYPKFFTAEFIQVLQGARRSLHILRAFTSETVAIKENGLLKWVWNEEGSVRLLDSDAETDVSVHDAPTAHPTPALAPIDHPSLEDIAQFGVYDMEPGSHLIKTAFLESNSDYIPLDKFMEDFPDELPSIAPTLPILVSLIMSPLANHCSAISGAALRMFLRPRSDPNLHLRSHLILLRSYVLLTSHAFKSRLSEALFSEREEQEYQAGAYGAGYRAKSRSRHTQSASQAANWKHKSRPGPWAVGLAFGLIERNSWPPGGSDLSFYLRRVIYDSLEHVRQSEYKTISSDRGGDESQDLEPDPFWADVEARLGFAIRDLPVGSGREKWLDPTCIEALDFLYLQYKPPKPLHHLITPDIMSKYQRVFGFLLRLMRVDNAMRVLYRLTRKERDPVFQTLSQSNKLLAHFRFVGQTFISTLLSYTYDIAIGGNFDAFLARVEVAEQSENFAESPHFSDVYSLMNYHSDVMDDILGACLLRSSQKSAGDSLRGCLEILLELAVLVGGLKRGYKQEFEVVPELKGILARFQGKMKLFMNALKKLADRSDGTHEQEDLPFILSESFTHEGGRHRHLPRAPGSAGSLRHLLLRLNFVETHSRNSAD